MTADQFASNAVNDPGELEAPFFAGQLTVIDHLEEQVPQFTLQMLEVALFDRIGHLVSFLKGERHKAGVSLLDIPRAAVLRVAQAGHEVKQVVECVHEYSLSVRILCSRCQRRRPIAQQLQTLITRRN